MRDAKKSGGLECYEIGIISFPSIKWLVNTVNPTVKLDIFEWAGEGRGRSKSLKNTERQRPLSPQPSTLPASAAAISLSQPVAAAASSSTIPDFYTSLQSPPQQLLAALFSTIVIHLPARRRWDPFRHKSPPQITSISGAFGYTKAHQFLRTAISPTATASLPSPLFRFCISCTSTIAVTEYQL